jgi:hypothetical protein
MAVLCVASDPSAPRRISQVASGPPCDAPTSVAALTQMKEAPSSWRNEAYRIQKAVCSAYPLWRLSLERTWMKISLKASMPARVPFWRDLLKLLETALVAAMFGWGSRSIASAWLCAESSCHSSFDRFQLFATALLGAALAGLTVRRVKHKWIRIALVAGTVLYAIVFPEWSIQRGRWTVSLPNRSSCVVLSRDSLAHVRKTCGLPSGGCIGPKHIDSDPWIPWRLSVCRFSGDIYARVMVAYRCDGGVDVVTALDLYEKNTEGPYVQCSATTTSTTSP